MCPHNASQLGVNVKVVQRYSWQAKLLIGFVSVWGLGMLCYGIWTQHLDLDPRFLSLLAVAVLASRLKVSLPELNGSMSVNLPFLLIAAAWLSLPAALIIGCASALAQSIPAKHSPFRPVEALFNFSTMAIAVGAGWAILNHALILQATELPEKMLLLIVAAGIFFVVQTVPVAVILSLTEGVRVLGVWLDIFTCTFPYYVLSASLSSLISFADRYVGWYLPLVTLLVMFGVYRSYRRYFRPPTASQVEPLGAMAKCHTAGAR